MQSSKRGYYQEKINFFLEELKRYNKKDKRIKILDIGCNDGELIKKYTKFGQVLGIDISKKAIKECKKKGLPCKLSDIESLPPKYNNYFNVVIAGDIIEHIFDTDRFLLKIHKVLKKDGKLLLTTPNLASLGRRILLLFGKNPFIKYSTKLPSKEFNVGHIRYYTPNNIKEQLKESGFRNIKIYGDRINLSNYLFIPHRYAKNLPTLSRNIMVCCQK